MPKIPKIIPLEVQKSRLEDLIRLVQGCRACPKMEGRKRVLSQLNGKATSDVLFVAEAPGRHGAEVTGIPIHGDATGINFETLLESIGWKRDKVYITNAVLCNPQDEQGNNRPPSFIESHNCSFHLEATIQVVNPVIVVTLGIKALEALNLIESHNVRLSEVVAQPISWYNRTLFPLYHPSPRALLARDMSKQREDFQKLATLAKELECH